MHLSEAEQFAYIWIWSPLLVFLIGSRCDRALRQQKRGRERERERKGSEEDEKVQKSVINKKNELFFLF